MSSNVENPVLYMKVTDALRAPGPDHLAELAKTYNIADFPNLLLLAVELSPYETIQWVVDLYRKTNRNVNEVDPKTGNTALHEAIANSRTRAMTLLMSLPTTDNTIRNKEGLTASEVACSPEMEQGIASAENKFAQNTALRLKTAFKNRDLNELVNIYSNPRVSELLDINGLDPDTGRGVLHDCAHAGDVKLVQFILAHGGDPMLRDRKHNKRPQDYTNDEDIKRVLNNAAKSRAIMDQTNGGAAGAGSQAGAAKAGPTSISGYLKKWTNITSGYKLRWFVLENGTLSYFKKPEDAKNDKLIKGSMGLRYAKVRLYSGEKNTFEIRTPSTKFHLKATHPAEANKWVWALQSAITFVRDEEKKASKSRSSRKSSDTESRGHASSGSVGGPGAAGAAGAAGAVGAAGASSASFGHNARSASLSSISSKVPPSTPGVSVKRTKSNGTDSSHKPTGRKFSTAGSLSDEPESTLFVNDLAQKDDDDDDDSDNDEYSDQQILRGPLITGDSLIARLSAIKDLLAMLVFQVEDETMRDAITTAQGSIDVLTADIITGQKQQRAKQRLMRLNLEQSDKGQRQWAANYRDLELQCEKLEGQVISLKKQLGKNDDDSDEEFFDTVDPVEHRSRSESVHATPSVPTVPEVPEPAEAGQKDVASASHDSGLAGSGADAVASSSASAGASTGAGSHAAGANAGAAAVGLGTASAGAGAAAADSESKHTGSTESKAESSTGSDSKQSETHQAEKEEEEEEGASAKEESSLTSEQREVDERIRNEDTFAGYEDPPRTKLLIDADNRPKLSLWGILKNLIGKDMTKMTLPVTFNECTSLLQRSAEDMEYVYLLDKAAAAVHDPGLRMAYVAAFAGSSYSSTIDRVAKPFNPLLGETYEYARPDQGYRLFAEQVSHHPPIGALIAESRNWDFYGESHVDSKFYGRSFDINPLGLWYLNLRPNKGAETESELYSFRKITSSVVGIMMGNPVVDNYGDMVITNHTLGIKGVISYKARGWRGSSAYKLQGKIIDKADKELWTIAGQWNDKIWAKKTGSEEKLMLWQANPRHKTPFNLTDFAITLNALPDNLKPWLAPTDTRLRPDQRAMEEGRYDDASDEKSRVEDKQRQARRAREASGQEHKPQWFRLEKHPVTGEDYYKPINKYWEQRGQKKLADKGDIF